MAKYKKVYEIIIEKAEEILKQFPEGLDYGSLTERIFSELPDIQKNSVHGTFTNYFSKFTNVVKPKRGFYVWIDSENPEQTIEQKNIKFENDYSVINGKITYIRLKNFQQFEDLEIDLTIPEGFENAGNPIEKVCFLGQSGTGKTTLLNLIRYFSMSESSKQSFPLLDLDIKTEIEIEYLIPEFVKVSILYKNKKLTYAIKEKLKELSEDEFDNQLYEFLKQIKHRLIYFPSDVIIKLDTTNNKPDTVKYESLMEDKIFDFTLLNPSYLWEVIADDIKEYNNHFADKSLEYTTEIIQNPVNKNKAFKEFNRWVNENPNPIKRLADECLNDFLSKFGVRVKTQLDKTENINFITLETNTGKELKLEQWSTGTKQIVMRGMSLYMLKPENSIVLFDEPENSLYPDVQNELIGFFSKMTKNSQLFFATHSPIIASSFEPYEIIELKYDTERYVKQEDYRKDASKPRHKENYKFYPKYLRWDSIYTKIFDLENDGSEERVKLLEELAYLDERINYLREEKRQSELNNTVEEYKKIAEKLAWKITENL